MDLAAFTLNFFNSFRRLTDAASPAPSAVRTRVSLTSRLDEVTSPRGPSITVLVWHLSGGAVPANSPDPTNARKLDEETAVSNPLDSPLPDLPSSGAAPGVDAKRAASDARLARELVGAGPELPEGRREAVVALLTGLMADRERLDDYQGCLKSMLKGATPERAEPSESLVIDERDERIAAEGFSWIPDEGLAALALSPRGLKALYELLEEPETETGEWFMDAMSAAHADRPKVVELEIHARERIARLLAEHDSSD